MLNEVVIDGVKLTRAQVLKALEALNAPKPWTPLFGDRFYSDLDIARGRIFIRIKSKLLLDEGVGLYGVDLSDGQLWQFASTTRLHRAA